VDIKTDEFDLGFVSSEPPAYGATAAGRLRGPTLPWWQTSPAYRRHNFRWNPFGEAPPAELGKMALVNEAALWMAPFQPVQILAPSGHGKTTHLLALQARHPGAIYEYVPFAQRKFRARPSPDQWFLLDEAQRVNARQLRDLFVRQPWLALGTHEDLQPHCPYPLRTLHIEALSLATLRGIVSRRMEWAKADPHLPRPALDDARLTRLLQSHGGNLRAIVQALYDSIQRGEM